MLTTEQIENIFESAFYPFVARVQIYDNGDKLRFRIFDTNGATLSQEYRSPVSLLQDPGNLHIFIHGARVDLMDRGLELGPWSFPEDELEQQYKL